MNLKTRIQLVLMPRSSRFPVRSLILPVDKNPKRNTKTLAMANAYTGIKNSIKSVSQVAKISTLINISIKDANDAGITVIDFEKRSKLCEL